MNLLVLQWYILYVFIFFFFACLSSVVGEKTLTKTTILEVVSVKIFYLADALGKKNPKNVLKN